MKNYHAPLVPGNYYHIFNRGNNRETLFSNDDNYHFFLQKLEKYILSFIKIYAYCLMPNHFHFLVQVRLEAEILESFKKVKGKANFTKLSKFSKVKESKVTDQPDYHLDINALLEERFQRFFTCYSLAYNKQQNRTGSLFEKRFKRIYIDSDNSVIKVIHYIHNNPIHHQFCRSYGDWKYSSYNAVISQEKNTCRKRVGHTLVWK